MSVSPLYLMTEVNKPGVNNRLKCCPEPWFDLTICNKVHVHTNTNTCIPLKYPQEIGNEIISEVFIKKSALLYLSIYS